MSSEFRTIILWLVGALIAVTVALATLSTSLVDGQYLPVGHDSFYHARRILDTVAQPGGFYEFDPKMHFPEGDWITWPWGYDYLMAQAVRGLMALTGSEDPMKVLVHLPPMFVGLAVGLILAIASALKLPDALKLLAVMCVAISPHTQVLFGLGSIDHHWAEQLFALGMVLGGLLWLQRPESVIRAAALGGVLGAAVACQAGLFVLQLPVLIALGLLWLRGLTPPARSGAAFAAALVVMTLLVSLPSAPFRMGWFQLYYLSWFQSYIALCTAIFAVALCRWSYRPTVLLALTLLALVLLVPVLAQLQFSGAFLSGKLAAAQQIDEIRSPFAIALSEGGLARVILVYTAMVFLAPITLIGCSIALLRERQRGMVFFWVVSIFGLVFVMLQQRLHGFGSFALYLPWLVFLQRLRAKYPQHQRFATIAVTLVIAVAYAPAVRYQLFAGHPPAMDKNFAAARKLYPVLARACHEQPGLVIADANDGHLIRYFTDCAVVGNNFRLTPRDVAKYQETERLLAMPLEEVLRQRPEARYVLARLVVPAEPVPVEAGASSSESKFALERLLPLNRGIFGDLLLGPRPITHGVEALAELELDVGRSRKIPFLGVFHIPAKSSAN